MTSYLGNQGFYKLPKEQMAKIKPEALYANQSSKSYELFSDILEFHTQDKSDNEKFIDFYYKKYQKNTDRTHILNKLRVQKRRLVEILENSTPSYTLDKDYNLFEKTIVTLENMTKDFFNIFQEKMFIKEIKIFDTYMMENKTLLFNDELKKILNKTLIDGGKVSLLSVFDSVDTKDFCKELLTENENSNLTIKYLRKPLHQSSSLVYFLITDKSDQLYLSYYEEITHWSLVTPIDSSNFSEQFFNLLNTRFTFFFEKKILENKSEVINVDKSLFNYDTGENNDTFHEKISMLVKDINSIVDNKDKKIIQEKVNEMIFSLKKVTIAYPKMYYTKLVLHYYIRLIDILSLVEDEEKPKTTYTFNQLLSYGIIEKLDQKIKTIFSSKDEFLLDAETFSKSDIKKLKTDIQTKALNQEDKALADIFPELNWNTKQLIQDSINKIILDKKFSFRLLKYCLKEQSSELEQNEQLLRFVVRKIFSYYSIPFAYDKLSSEEKEIILKLKFYEQKIKDIFAIVDLFSYED